jgi:hypothetical protein
MMVFNNTTGHQYCQELFVWQFISFINLKIL